MCPEPTALNFVVKCGNLFFPMTVLLRSNDPIFIACQTSYGKVMFSVMSVCQSVMSCLCVHRTCRPYTLLNEQVWTCLGGGLGPYTDGGPTPYVERGRGLGPCTGGNWHPTGILSCNHVIGGSSEVDLRLGISDSFLGILFGNWQIAHDIRVHSTTIHAVGDQKEEILRLW